MLILEKGEAKSHEEEGEIIKMARGKPYLM